MILHSASGGFRPIPKGRAKHRDKVIKYLEGNVWVCTRYDELTCAHWGQELRGCLFCVVLDDRPILHEHNINTLYNGFEKWRRNARAMKVKSRDIAHTACWSKPDEWGHGVVLNVSKIDVYVYL